MAWLNLVGMIGVCPFGFIASDQQDWRQEYQEGSHELGMVEAASGYDPGAVEISI